MKILIEIFNKKEFEDGVDGEIRSISDAYSLKEVYEFIKDQIKFVYNEYNGDLMEDVHIQPPISPTFEKVYSLDIHRYKFIEDTLIVGLYFMGYLK